MFLVSAWGFEPVALILRVTFFLRCLTVDSFCRCNKRESIPLLSKLNVWGRTITLGELPRSG